MRKDFEHRGERTCKVRVVYLRISQPSVVQDLQLCLVRLGNIPEVLLVVLVHLFRIGQTLLVPQMVPIGRSKSNLDIAMPLFRRDGLHVLKLSNVRALSSVADLAITDNTLTRDLLVLQECSDVRDVLAEDLWVRAEDLFHAIERGEEGAPEHMPAVFTITDCSKAALGLHLDDFVDAFVLELREVRAGLLLLLNSMSLVEELGGPEEGT